MSCIREKILKLTQQQINSKYQFKELIDSGSYGVVFKYVDKNSLDQVAIKILKDQDGVDTFQNQFQIMKNIDHPNVLKCLGFYFNTTKNKYILIMPYCQKNNLRKCLPEIEKFDEKFKLWMCVQIARGIKAMHDINIMHRDIKPANILIDGDWTIKLCDFGFGRKDQSLEKTARVGTPLYRDPNVNSGNYSKKCDIYSVGLVIDTIFRGKSCYNNVPPQRFPQELLYFKQNKNRIIKTLKCNEEIKSIILDCLKNNQSERIDSIQLLDRLQRAYSKLDPFFIPKSQYKQFSLSSSPQIKQKNEQLRQNNDQKTKKRQIDLKKPFIQCEDSYQNHEQVGQGVKSQKKVQQITPKEKIFNKRSLSMKSNTSLSENNNKITTHLKLFGLRNNLVDQIEKNSNFQNVYTHFVGRRKKIRELQTFRQINSIPKRDKKVIIFIALFGYLRFLKVNRLFLEKKQKYISSINEIPLQKISQKTRELCLNLIQLEIDSTRQAIKPYLLDLNADKSLYREEILSKKVLQMILDGVEKKFTNIERFPIETIKKQYQNILMNQSYETKDQEEKQKKALLKEIIQIC